MSTYIPVTGYTAVFKIPAEGGTTRTLTRPVVAMSFTEDGESVSYVLDTRGKAVPVGTLPNFSSVIATPPPTGCECGY